MALSQICQCQHTRIFFLIISHFILAFAASSESESEPIDVYYINLDRRPDRNANIQREFQAAGIVPPLFHVHRFPAVDGLSHEMTEEEKKWFQVFDDTVGKTSPHNTNLLKANSLSHMGVWQRVVDSKADLALVFQDDVQLSSANFVTDLNTILQHNPKDALITWIGVNGYADGSVSRSAPLDASTYNPDQISTAIPPANVIGQCRKGLIATSSLAYILTQKGAQALLKYFTNTGWSHHTDHALVDYLDDRGVSYISRTILATTHDDGILGSDIFQNSQPDQEALEDCQSLIRKALSLSKHCQSKAMELYRTNKIPTNNNVPDWLHALNVQCEAYRCHFADCPAPIVTYVYLSFTSSTDECETTLDGTCSSKDDDNNNNKFELDASGVRRDKTRKKFMLGKPPAKVTMKDAVQQLPASWALEAWSKGEWDVAPSPWPVHDQGDAVEALVDGMWLPAKVVAVGYKEASWPMYATYVVQVDADKRLIPIVQPNQVRRLSR